MRSDDGRHIYAREAYDVAILQQHLRALAPQIAEARSAIDRERRLPADLFSAQAEAGLCHPMVHHCSRPTL
jgi:hypothetical protein